MRISSPFPLPLTDLQKIWLKTAGEYTDGDTEESEVRLLYGQAISANWDVLIGYRRDMEPEPERNWLELGVQGTAPYFIDSELSLFVGESGTTGLEITAEKEFMSLILTRLKKDNLYFIDSVTSGRSIAFKLAREMSVLSACRHVFLDSETEEGYIQKQLIQLLRLAQRQGVAVGICHPYDSTLKVLSDNLGLFEEYNCETVFASQIVK